VDAVVVLPQPAQHHAQLAVTNGPRAGRAGLGGVVAARGHLQHPADGLDPEPATVDDVVLVGVDEGDYLLEGRSSSAAKKLAARRKISFARRSSRTSCSRSRTRCDSSAVVPATRPWSISACLTQVRTDSTP